MKTCKSIRLLLGALCVSVGFLPGYALSQAPFYEGKTITIIQGRDPGGTGDLRARSLVPFLQKYIPGNPTIVMEYMPGGGGRKAANHLYRSARPDGLTPDLYVALAISGACQHTAGCSGAKVIVAVNNNPEAEIFKEARYGVVGDWKKILPAFTEALQGLMS